MERTHLLILGSPRSGTTLLASMIGAHSQASVLVEDPRLMLTNLVGTPVVGNKLCIPTNVELERRSRRPQQLIGALVGADRLPRMPWVVRRIVQPFSRYSIRDYLALDNVRVVGIIRAGGAVVHSIMARSGFGYPEASYQWRRAVEVLDELARTEAASLRIVSYEGLVEDPDGVMRSVAAFLGLDYEPAMVHGYRYNTYYPGRTAVQAKSMTAEASALADRLASEHPGVMARYRALLERC